MRVRFSSFTGTREVRKTEGGYTTRVDFELPHRMMLCNMSRDELFYLSEQCEDLLANPQRTPTVYLGTIDSIEEVSNEIS